MRSFLFAYVLLLYMYLVYLLNMSFNIKKSLGIFCYYITPLILAVFSFLMPSTDWYVLIGNWALYLLGIILFVKPLAAILKNNLFWTIVSWRRELGVLVFWLFFFHGAGFIYTYNLYKPIMWKYLSDSTYWGLVAGLGLLALTLTSNTYSIKLLKRNWKRLHYAVYFIFFATLLHVALFKGEFFVYSFWFSIFAVLKIIEFRKLKQTTVVK